uniref:Uncharacterized protein n=1 Tax=Oryza barthii TaxID=65489 RepID=A0A0D3FL16_9ORYZ
MAAAAGWSGGVRAEGRRTEREGKGSPVRRPWKVFPKIAEQINKMAATNRNKIATKSTPPLHGPEDAAGGWGGGRNGWGNASAGEETSMPPAPSVDAAGLKSTSR